MGTKPEWKPGPMPKGYSPAELLYGFGFVCDVRGRVHEVQFMGSYAQLPANEKGLTGKIDGPNVAWYCVGDERPDGNPVGLPDGFRESGSTMESVPGHTYGTPPGEPASSG